MSVHRAQQEVSSREFVEWAAFYGLEPFGDMREDFRIAQLCSIMANAWRGKRGRTYRLKDFMPFLHSPHRFETPDHNKVAQMAERMKAWAKRMGAEVNGG